MAFRLDKLRIHQKWVKGFHYFIHNEKTIPVITVAVLREIGVDGKFYRGIAVCQPKHHPNKTVGKNKAIGRATSVVVNFSQVTGHMRMDEIRREEIVQLFGSLSTEVKDFFQTYLLIPFGKRAKLAWNELTEFEKKVFSGKKEEN